MLQPLTLKPLRWKGEINTFKYHVSCTDGKISVRINLLFYLYFPPSSHPKFVCFFPVGLLLLIKQFQQILWELKLLLFLGLGSDLNSNCQLPKSGDRRNFNSYNNCWKCCINNERPTGKKHTNFGWDDGGK